MAFLKKLSGFLSSPNREEKDSYWIYARCAYCGEKLRTRISLFNDLSASYAENDGQDIYICRKTLVGNQRCFRRIEIKLNFDDNRKLIDREIVGGEFITDEEYQAG